jgi:hypothetical protein
LKPAWVIENSFLKVYCGDFKKMLNRQHTFSNAYNKLAYILPKEARQQSPTGVKSRHGRLLLLFIALEIF